MERKVNSNLLDNHINNERAKTVFEKLSNNDSKLIQTFYLYFVDSLLPRWW